MKFKEQVLEYNKPTLNGDVYVTSNGDITLGTVTGDKISDTYVGDIIDVNGGGGGMTISPHQSWGIGGGSITAPAWSGSHQILSTKNTDSTSLWEDLVNTTVDGTIRVKNKMDKDLIDSKLPYNLKKDYKGNLIYEIAVAGYENVLIQKIKDGLRVLLDDVERDDLIGEEYEYICQGIKMKKQEMNIFIDQDDFDTKNHTASLENGILSLFVPIKSINSEEFVSVQSSNKKRKIS
jgi:HSP20 family molecular chaperone IbpA